MIEVICKEGKFLAKGTFSFGIVGTFTNKDFVEEGEIYIPFDLEDVLEALQDEKDSWYKPLFPYLKQEKLDGDTIAVGIAAYYNQREKEIKENEKQINDCILSHLFLELVDCDYPFWEIEEAILPEILKSYDKDSIEKIYDNVEEIYDWYEEFDFVPNNGTIQKTDVEGKLRELFPMFNFDGLFQSIVPSVLVLDGHIIDIEFSDSWGAELFCSAVCSFDKNLAATGWDNH